MKKLIAILLALFAVTCSATPAPHLNFTRVHVVDGIPITVHKETILIDQCMIDLCSGNIAILDIASSAVIEQLKLGELELPTMIGNPKKDRLQN